jgi:hypothetical protein
MIMWRIKLSFFLLVHDEIASDDDDDNDDDNINEYNITRGNGIRIKNKA